MEQTHKIGKKHAELNGGYDSVNYYASTNMWQLQGQKSAFWGIFDPTVTLTFWSRN